MAKLSPSILSADFANLQRDIKMVENAGAQLLHIDVMDGHFVPNLTIGAPVAKAIRKITDMTLDVHLMISEPDRYIEDFAKAGADIITVHYESDGDTAAQIEKIKSFGIRAGVSVKPKTPISELYRFLDRLDLALIMTVEPGFGGQSLIPEAADKIPELKKQIELCGSACEIEIDGGVNLKNASELIKKGADILVAGSAVFNAEDPVDAVRAFCGL